MDKLGFISGLVVNVAVHGFWFVRSYILTIYRYRRWMVQWLPKPSSQVADMETCISGSGRVSVSGRNSISGTIPIPQPSRARDLITMAEVGSARLTSLDRVTTGVRWVSRGTREKPNSFGRSLLLPLPEGAVP